MNIAHWLERTARHNPTAPALLQGVETVADYSVFSRSVEGLGGWLRAQGIGPGDRVALFMKNCTDYLIAMFGVWQAGAVVVPVNCKLHAREAAWIVENSGASLVFATPDLAEALRQATDIRLQLADTEAFAQICASESAQIIPREGDDLAWLFYTSGTTGRPKGVQITHRMLMGTSLAYPLDVDAVTSEDAACYAAPMSHGAGLYAAVHVACGARHIVPESGGFGPEEILALAATAGPVSMFMAPTMVRRLTDKAKTFDLRGDGIKTIVYGGGPMYLADIIEAVDWFGPKFVQIYGQGECPMAITSLSRGNVANRTHPNWRERLQSVGRAQSVVEVKIGDAAGQEVPRGTIGEIMVKGLPVMPGYWKNQEATRETLRDGWLLTGDMGRMDEDGFVVLNDRSKDVIISGGTNIYPREVEEVLLTHPGVHEVSVVGRPNTEWGEDVVAFIVPTAGCVLDQAALDAHCLERIARFKRPKEYFELPELPKNNYGKVLKTALRERIGEQRG